MTPNNPTNRVAMRTTLPRTPLPPVSERREIHTKRLLIRPLVQEDLRALHTLRLQPEAMTGTTSGKADSNIEETQAALDEIIRITPESFLFGAFLADTGELIGEGGVHTFESEAVGWPEIGYKFKKECWGRGFAGEFLRGLLSAWWELPRNDAELNIHVQAADGTSEPGGTREHVYANFEVDNLASRRVLEKLGFERFSEWTEPDTQLHRLGQPVTLVGFKLPRP